MERLGDGARVATRRRTGRSFDEPLFAMLGFDPATGTIRHGGGLTATPMARLREETRDCSNWVASPGDEADAALAGAGTRRIPVAVAHPLTDLRALFSGLRASGRRIAIATSDDREPTLRTLAALGVADAVEAVMCADDGVAVKPAADMIGPPLRSPRRGAGPNGGRRRIDRGPVMGRAAGAGVVVGVLTGVGRLEDLAPHADAVIESVADLHIRATSPRAVNQNASVRGMPASRAWRCFALVAAAREAEHEEEQVHEVEVERQGAHDGRLLLEPVAAARLPALMRWTS